MTDADRAEVSKAIGALGATRKTLRASPMIRGAS